MFFRDNKKSCYVFNKSQFSSKKGKYAFIKSNTAEKRLSYKMLKFNLSLANFKIDYLRSDYNQPRAIYYYY